MIARALVAFALGAVAIGATPAWGAPVWFTDGAAVTRLATETGTLASRDGWGPVRAVVPLADGGAWVLAGTRLVRVGPDLTEAAAMALEANPALPRAALAGEPDGDGAWLAAGDVVRHVAADGVVVAQWRHVEPIDDVVAGGPDAIWVASAGGVTRYDDRGVRLRHAARADGESGTAASALLLDRRAG